MSYIIQWIPFLLFMFLFVGAIIAEVQWLTRKGWATSGRATGYVFTTNLLAFGIGSLVGLVAFFIMFMMVMGPAGRGSDIPGSAYVVVTVIASILSSIFFILSKRLFLLIFKIASGKSAWIYSVASSVFIILVVLIPPPAVFFATGYLSQWK